MVLDPYCEDSFTFFLFFVSFLFFVFLVFEQTSFVCLCSTSTILRLFCYFFFLFSISLASHRSSWKANRHRKWWKQCIFLHLTCVGKFAMIIFCFVLFCFQRTKHEARMRNGEHEVEEFSFYFFFNWSK